MNANKVQTLADQYRRLTNDEAKRFHELIVSRAEDVYQLLQRLSDHEKVRFFDALLAQVGNNLVPHFMRVAIRLVRERPDADNESLMKAITESDNQFASHGFEELMRLAKKKRDRKVLPETIRRNSEILAFTMKIPTLGATVRWPANSTSRRVTSAKC